ncbi:uncharacterized protein LOC142531755 [Primulina tabacum]|uniref:uncharacterized protein LOC142531755 n=1 Tax=Primulina tabacum TaxID=48773 RepID=UPI003F5A299E
MAPLHGFKMLATKCTVAGSPTRSPTTSPVIPLRRRKTLRMLLSHGDGEDRPPGKGKSFSVSRKLKDLFLSSPPGLQERVARKRLSPTSGGGAGGGVGRCGARSRRPTAATFRQRLLRRAWRPLLVAIPE